MTTRKPLSLTFQLSANQQAKLDAWVGTLHIPKPGEPGCSCIGGSFTYCLTPTTLGDILVVRFNEGLPSQQEINLTEFEDW